MPAFRFTIAFCLCSASLVAVISAQDVEKKKGEPAKKPDPSLLTIDRIYNGKEFTPQSASARWLPDGSGYTTLEESGKTTAKDIVRHSPDSAEKSVLVSAAQLTPDLETGPISIEGYEFSKDHSPMPL